MASPQARRSILARTLPAIALVAVAAACVFFALSTAPAPDSTGIATGDAAFIALPAWFTAGLALLAAAALFLGHENMTVYRGGGLLGMCAAVGAAAGGFLNLIGYSNSNVWWAADPGALRTAAGILLVVALLGLAVVAAEQLRPGWRPRQDSNLRPKD